jgi:hypothetical protein
MKQFGEEAFFVGIIALRQLVTASSAVMGGLESVAVGSAIH